MFNKRRNNRIVVIFLLFTLFSFHGVLAQKIPRVDGHRKILVTPASKKITAVVDTRHKPKISADKTYYWYDNIDVHETQGGYYGYVLDGPYAEFYFPGNNLCVSGDIKRGVKNGKWTYWFTNGTLKETSNWDNGQLDGLKSCYSPDGKLLTEENYRDGLLNGSRTIYNNDGTKMTEIYKDNVRVVDTLEKEGKNEAQSAKAGTNEKTHIKQPATDTAGKKKEAVHKKRKG